MLTSHRVIAFTKIKFHLAKLIASCFLVISSLLVRTKLSSALDSKLTLLCFTDSTPSLLLGEGQNIEGDCTHEAYFWGEPGVCVCFTSVFTLQTTEINQDVVFMKNVFHDKNL